MAKKIKTIHEGNAVNKDFIAMTLPLFVMAFFFYGPRVFLLAIIAVFTAKVADRASALLRGKVYDKTENTSTVIALIIVLLSPATVRVTIVVAAVLIGVLVGKEAFGGYQSYPFNPSAVGFCAAAVSWPQEMLRYPNPSYWMLDPVAKTNLSRLWELWTFKGQSLVEGPSYTIKMGGLPNLDDLSLVLGDYAGPLGVSSVLVIVACAAYLVVKKRIKLAAPLSFLLMAAVLVFVFPRATNAPWPIWPWEEPLRRLNMVKLEVLSGALPFLAVFMVPEQGTLPKNIVSQLIYGALLGFATIMFRYFGTFELGACFAFLLVNAVSGYFDRAVARGFAKKGAVAQL